MKVKLLVAALASLVAAATASALSFGAWGPVYNVESLGADAQLNTAKLEGCPSISRDGLTLYFASDRAGGLGKLDIWIATRASTEDAWGAPTNPGVPINTAADEFCPTPLRDGHGFLFVSTKSGGCGGSDIYATRRHVTRGWADPENLGCGVNSAADEASPFIVGEELYFSSTRAGGFAPDAPGAVAGDSDLYVGPVAEDGFVGTPALVPNVNTAFQDARPNLRRDGRELFFDSNRPGGSGGLDLWTATRPDAGAAWCAPANLGSGVNSSANDLRASLSWDGTALYFGSTRAVGEGSQDLYVTTRERVPAGEEESC